MRTLLALFIAFPLLAQNAATPPKLPGRAALQQKLGSQLPLDTFVRDENGGVHRLGDYFGHGRPVLLQFMYYRCPMLCSIVGDGLVRSLTELRWDVGKEYDVVTISIDPRDMPKTAAMKKDEYVRHYGRLSTAGGWHFLTANETAIKHMTDAAGFEFSYDPQSDQFAHAAGILIVTPNGVVSRYLYGFEYKPRDLRLAIAEASEGKIGGTAEQLLLLCYHYDPAIGKYSRSAMTFVRAGSVTTLFALAGFIVFMVRTDRKPKTDNR
ncbi:MAG TPA: SCO family protein [Thermoanaerobaculia bacterium]|jgi:protein SCO1/2|nr:SCO family protein [Thermoanaerobaculia bacterium]